MISNGRSVFFSPEPGGSKAKDLLKAISADCGSKPSLIAEWRSAEKTQENVGLDGI